MISIKVFYARTQSAWPITLQTHIVLRGQLLMYFSSIIISWDNCHTSGPLEVKTSLHFDVYAGVCVCVSPVTSGYSYEYSDSKQPV